MQRGMKVISSGLLDYYKCVPTTRPMDGMLVYKKKAPNTLITRKSEHSSQT